ncbi:unnamed protein product [Bemisia tabaci]|uniref:Uncharacterized protein n=1 Tax=Bemisia tabaci TaxID=7038 RepID=A0A9P0AQ18_BEMTA|nr:unnamed protein product [Bemisia tabaci]
MQLHSRQIYFEFYSSLTDLIQKPVTTLIKGMQLQMKQLKKDGRNLIDCEWKDLLIVLTKEPFYTTFIKSELESNLKSAWCDLWLGLDPPSASSHPTACTSMPSLCANTQIAHVDATSQIPSEDYMESGFLLSALQQQLSTERDGVISQYICHAEGEYQLKFQTPGEIGYATVKLEIYLFSQMVKEEKMNWWRHAKTRALIHFNTPMDPDLVLIKKILDRKARALDQLEGTERKTTRYNPPEATSKGTRGSKF